MDDSINKSIVKSEYDDDEQTSRERYNTRLSQNKMHAEKIGTITSKSGALTKKIDLSGNTCCTECGNRRHPFHKQEGGTTANCLVQQSATCKNIPQHSPPSGNIGNILSILNDMTASEIRGMTGSSSIMIDELMMQAR